MDLVEDDPSHLTSDLTSVVKHRPQDLGGHDDTRGRLVDGDIACHEPHIAELSLQFSKLLVAERLNGRRVYDTLVVLQTLSDGVLCHCCLSGRGVRCDQDGLAFLDAVDGLLLELIKFELVLLGHFLGTHELVGSLVALGLDELVDAIGVLHLPDLIVCLVVAHLQSAVFHLLNRHQLLDVGDHFLFIALGQFRILVFFNLGSLGDGLVLLTSVGVAVICWLFSLSAHGWLVIEAAEHFIDVHLGVL
mmetsp:Transcript_14784/g.22925  ORF Transcript_14784/g.22925 Transcript_14784/m.22925 type:complete len:247 (-) Transcript_14784:6-746(-)